MNIESWVKIMKIPNFGSLNIDYVYEMEHSEVFM